jgi:hypothetical protein
VVQGGSLAVLSRVKFVSRLSSPCQRQVSFHDAQFTHTNALTLIARAHQLVQEGYKPMFGGLLVTVWSAPNYVYRSGNRASVLALASDGGRAFKVFDAAPENERERATGPGGRKLVRVINTFR